MNKKLKFDTTFEIREFKKKHLKFVKCAFSNYVVRSDVFLLLHFFRFDSDISCVLRTLSSIRCCQFYSSTSNRTIGVSVGAEAVYARFSVSLQCWNNGREFVQMYITCCTLAAHPGYIELCTNRVLRVLASCCAVFIRRTWSKQLVMLVLVRWCNMTC